MPKLGMSACTRVILYALSQRSVGIFKFAQQHKIRKTRLFSVLQDQKSQSEKPVRGSWYLLLILWSEVGCGDTAGVARGEKERLTCPL